MQHRKIIDDSGSAGVEFTLLAALFVAPTLAAAQQITAVQLRQASLDSIAQTLAREYSVHRDTFRLIGLAEQLSEDAGMQGDLVSWQLDCDGDPACVNGRRGQGAETMSITVDYRQVSGRAMQILDDGGSVLPLMLASFALVFAVLAVGVNIQAASLYDQRASSLARYLVHRSLSASPKDGHKDLTELANEISKKMMFSSQPVESAWLSSADGKTSTVSVCLGFKGPLDVISLPASRACASASMRKIER